MTEFFAPPREFRAAKRQALAKELQAYMADKLYGSTVLGSPFCQTAQPWVKGYAFHAEFGAHDATVWLDR